MSEFQASVNDFIRRYGIEPKPPTSYTGAEPRIIPSGARNDTLTQIAGLLRKTGMAPNLIDAAIRGIATNPEAVASTSYDDGELERIIEHIAGRSSEAFSARSYEVETIDVDSVTVPPLKWLIPGFMPAEGLTLLFGLPAAGKSWTALDVACTCLTGERWLNGEQAAKIKRVGYVDWERRGAMFKRRMINIARGKGIAIDYVTAMRPLSEMIDDVRELALVRGWELIILDSLSIAIMTGDLLSAHEVIPRMFALHELGIPILILDHMAKPQPGTNPANASAYGSMFKEAVVSMAWHVAKAGSSEKTKTEGYMDFRLIQKKQNFDKASHPIDAHLLMEENADGDIIRVELRPGFKDVVPDDMTVLDAIAHRSETTIKQVCDATGLGYQAVHKMLHNERDGLIKQGLVYVVAQGGGRGNESTYAVSNWPDSNHPA